MSKNGGRNFFQGQAPRVYTIPAYRPFLHDLAAGIQTIASDCGEDPLAIRQMEIFLPTRRAVRGLTDALITANPGSGAILPRIKPLGDISDDEGFGVDTTHELSLPPAVSIMTREIFLARTIAARDRCFQGQENWGTAIIVARELAGLIDSFYSEEIDFAVLEKIAPDAFADHWKKSLEFLSIVTKAWPEYLNAAELLDPTARRIALVNAQCEHWLKEPPNHPILIAGTTGSTPAVARLAHIAARLPNGHVVLPGLDLNTPDKVWDVIDDPHPQMGLQRFISALEITRSGVRKWPQTERRTDNAARQNLISMTLHPAEATASWRDDIAAIKSGESNIAPALDGLSLIEASTEDEEAAIISLKLRETLETAGRTAILVTPDRTLARRVSAKMLRWNVTVDDSAGQSFSNSPCGVFLRLVAAWLAGPDDPIRLLSLLRHPLCRLGLDPEARNNAIDLLDIELRGLRPTGGFAGLMNKVSGSKKADHLTPILRALEKGLACWTACPDETFAAKLDAHLQASEVLAEDAQDASASLWRGEDGEAGAQYLAELRNSAPGIGAVEALAYPDAFSQMVAAATVRVRSGAHPRLAILGPLEARLQSADLIILGALNEGVWPADVGADPFLSRPMRADAGLPSPERRIGLAAHDFAQLANAPEVILSRSLRIGTTPSKPSRWITRLKNVLAGAGFLAAVDQSASHRALAARLDQPDEYIRVKQPEPRPPVSIRPRALYVTRIEKWLRDPYSIYARTILDLKVLDPIDQPFGRLHLGNLLHTVFEKFVVAPRNDNSAAQNLIEILERYKQKFGVTPAREAFWGGQLKAALVWFEAWDAERHSLGEPAIIEDAGSILIEAPGGNFRLSAKADRIDLLTSGAAIIFDYKTGLPPTLKQAAKFSPQLPLTALIVERGGFEKLGIAKVEGFAYIKALNRSKSKNEDVAATGDDARKLIDDTARGVTAWIAAFDDPDMPYRSQPRPEYLATYGDYDILARRKEWAAEDDT